MASGVQLVDRNGDPLTTVNGALSVSQNHGKYYDQAQDNRVYVGTSLTAGIALIVAATSGNHPTLWNPAGSGRVVSLISLHLAYISGANAPGSLAWNHTLDAGAQVGTAGAILTGTKVAVQNANIGGPVGSKAIWMPAINTYTAAPVDGRPIGLSLFTGLAATATIPFPLIERYDGDLTMQPGTALSLVTVNATTTALFRVTVVYEEVDL